MQITGKQKEHNIMEEKNIVAIDLGTSKIALTVAKVNGDDIQVVYYKEVPSAGIKYSSVYNILHVTEPLSRIIKDAEESLDIKITQVVVGMPKYPVRQESNSGIINDRGEDADITAEDIAELKRYAEDSYPLEDPSKDAIYGAVAQSFSDGENFQIIENDIIGMVSDVLEGHFKIFIGKKSDLNKIDKVMKKTDISVSKKYFTAETTAKAVLTEAEMENGVALIDFGGGSTSLTIYHGSIMRHYASIPFGGKNITSDIQIESEGSISRELAENIKLATENEINAMVSKATAECNELKEQARQYAIAVTESARNFIASSLAGYQGIAMNNLDQINKVNTQFQSEYAAQVRNLGIDK